MEIEIRHARVVATVAASGSISKAAIALGVPQPSVTAQLRRIEKAIGGELFVRSSSGITPTALGERLIPLLADLAARADAVIAVASSLSSGVLRIGTEWNCAALSPALQKSLPYWEVRTETLDPMASVDAVYRGVLTAAVVPNVPDVAPLRASESIFATEVIVREPLCVALPAEQTAAELAELTWVRHVREHWLHPVEEHVFAELGFEPKVLHDVRRQTDAMRAVVDEAATALVTPTGAGRDVHLVPLEAAPRVDLLLMWRRGSLHPNTRYRLATTLRTYYCDYAAGLPDYWAWLVDHPAEFPELASVLPRKVMCREWV